MQFTGQGFSMGPLFVHYYGIVLMLGAVLGGVLAANEAKRRGHDPELVWDLLIWLIIGGIVGARLWHILTPAPSAIASGITTMYYLTHPLDAIAVWNGGLGIEGAIAGGMIALILFTRRNKLDFLEWTDIGAPGLALGQAIGRWGNFFNQELYGVPTNLPWKLYIDPAHRLNGYENVQYYHPLFFYESILNLLNMLFLLWIARRFAGRLKKGDVFLAYLVIYPTIRFFLEFLRIDSSFIAGVNINQVIAAAVAILAAAALIWRHRPTASESVEAQSEAKLSSVAIETEEPVEVTKSVGKSSSTAAAKKSKPAAKKSTSRSSSTPRKKPSVASSKAKKQER